jgi:hypothetical protein
MGEYCERIEEYVRWYDGKKKKKIRLAGSSKNKTKQK